MPILNNLYPPVVPDTMPAFNREEQCNIGFSIPIYNSKEDIAENLVQISITNLKTNISAFNKKLYPSGIKFATMTPVNNLYGYNYIVPINKNDLINGRFELNTFYKVQLRFTKKIDKISKPKKEKESEWFESNSSNFSEWSKACIIKGISAPTLTLNNFSENNSKTSEVILSNPLIDITGKLVFSKNENEYLKNYNIKILDGETKKILFRSEDIYPTAKNEFNYVLPYALKDGDTYFL